MNSKTTKRALLSSVVAMLVCFTMLLSTTFAWFTDTAVSANNIITSGNLDVEFYWSTDAANWSEVTENTNVFSSEKWEPGHTEVVYLQVKNAGSLALKYQFGINVISETAGVNAAGDNFNLSNYIQFGVIETETAYADRDAAREAVTDAKIISTGYTKAANLVKTGDTDTVALVVFMPETVGNEANHNGTEPQIKLGLNVLATQFTYEKDSFDNQYDANAAFSTWDGTIPTEMPETLVVDTTNKMISINDAKAFAYLNTLVNDPNFYTNYGSKWQYSIELNADIDLGNKAWTPITLSNFVSFDGNGHTIKNLHVDTAAENGGLFASINCNDIGATYVKDFTISNAFVRSAKRAGTVAGASPQGVISNVTVENATVIGTKYVGGIFGGGNGSVINSTVKDSFVIISEGGEKEAGGLIGYLANDGKPSSDNKVISGNTVENVTVSAPSIASALVSQPNSANTGTAVIVIEFNTVKNVTVTTADNTADIFVSNNVTPDKTVVNNNTEINCTVNKSGTPIKVAFPTTTSDTKAALNDGANYIDAQGANLGAFNYMLTSSNVSAGETVIIKNAVIEGKSYGNAVAGTVVFENCTFTNTGAYSIHFDAGSGYVVFNNCVLEGWCSFGTAIKGVTMNDCTILGNGTYALVRCYQDVTMSNCVIDSSNTNTTDIYQDGIDVVEGYTATMINCTNVNGSIEEVFEAEDIAGTDGKVIIK